MSVVLTAIAAGAAAGLASSAHCAAMCGPLAALAGRDARGALGYHGARLAAYALAGALAGGTGTLLAEVLPGRFAGALLSWTLAVALALTAWRLWRGEGAPRARLAALGRGPRRDLASRVLGAVPRHPAVVGGLTALLPCGALYAALLVAAGSGSPLGGALSTLAFAIASALGLGAVSVLATRARRPRGPAWRSRAFAAALIVGAIVLAVRPIDALRGEDPAVSCHE